jgi:hypothetical protein
MTRTELVYLVARRMMIRELPLIEGQYLWDDREINHLGVWDDADSFKRSEYMRRANRHYQEIEAAAGTPVKVMYYLDGVFKLRAPETGTCECLKLVGLPADKFLKNPRVTECQRCGGET